MSNKSSEILQRYLQKKALYYSDIISVAYDENPGLSNTMLGKHIQEETGIKNAKWRQVVSKWKELNHIKQKEEPVKKNSVDVEKDLSEDEAYDQRSVGDSVRDASGRITHYHYKILIKDQPSLIGEFTRDQMDIIYRLYSSNDGAGLNRRSVSREFPSLTFRDFKRILRAFNITKDSIPVAPHILEENDPEKVKSIIRQHKENTVLKKLEEGRGLYFEKEFRKLQREKYEERYNRVSIIEALNDLIDNEAISPIVPITLPQKPQENNIAINVYLADIHIGADSLDAQYEFLFDDKEIFKRGDLVIQELLEVKRKLGHIDTINLCNLGDSLDGWDGKTTRGGHDLSQRMNNKEQARVYMKLLRFLVQQIHCLELCNKLSFRAVTDDNHSGDSGWLANIALAMRWELEYPDMKIQVFEKYIEHFEWEGHTFVMMHGKDGKAMKRNMPLTLDEKTENIIDDYLNYHKIGGTVHVIKGDLHQSARQLGSRFSYKNTISFYGSSAYCQLNFGDSPAGCDYDIVFANSPRIWEGCVLF